MAMIYKPFHSGLSSIPLIIAILIGLGTFIIFTMFQGKIKTDDSKYILRTDWLYKNGKPRRICFLFSFTNHFLEFIIIFGWLLRHLILSFIVFRDLFGSIDLNTQLLPFHPDGMFGLSQFEVIAKSTGFVFSALGLILISWVLGLVSTYGGWKHVINNVGVALALITFIALAPLGIALPLESAHLNMIKTKFQTLKVLNRNVVQIDSNLNSEIYKDSTNNVAMLNQVLEQSKIYGKLYNSVSDVPNWPLRMGSMINIILQILLPPLLAIILEKFKRKNE
ncbi:hypothetical protein ACFL4L_02620 [bacterium]